MKIAKLKIYLLFIFLSFNVIKPQGNDLVHSPVKATIHFFLSPIFNFITDKIFLRGVSVESLKLEWESYKKGNWKQQVYFNEILAIDFNDRDSVNKFVDELESNNKDIGLVLSIFRFDMPEWDARLESLSRAEPTLKNEIQKALHELRTYYIKVATIIKLLERKQEV